MWRRTSGIVGLAVLIALPTFAVAHDNAVSGPVKSTIHIDPDDSPVIGQTATIQIQLSRSGTPLDVDECTCSLTIIKNKTTVATITLTKPADPSVWTATVPFTFPAHDTYTLALNGTPKNDLDAFEPFTLKTVFRILRTDATQPATAHDPEAWTHQLHYLLPAAAGVFLIIGLITQFLRRRKVISTK